MSLEILQIGHPTLRKQAKPLTKEEILSDETQTLIQAMCETMWAAPGVGLAAPQIGKSLQIIVTEGKPEYTQKFTPQQLVERDRQPFPLQILINPKIVLKLEDTAEFFEGCLSIEGFIAIVPRLLIIEVEALNEKAEPCYIKARGWYARILQHEIDHLNGILCTDRMQNPTLMTIDNYNQYWLKKSLSETKSELLKQ